PDARPRVSAAAGGAAVLRLEECEVGTGRGVHGGRPAGVLGELGPRRLPHARRPVGRTAVPPGLRLHRPRRAVTREEGLRRAVRYGSSVGWDEALRSPTGPPTRQARWDFEDSSHPTKLAGTAGVWGRSVSRDGKAI